MGGDVPTHFEKRSPSTTPRSHGHRHNEKSPLMRVRPGATHSYTPPTCRQLPLCASTRTRDLGPLLYQSFLIHAPVQLKTMSLATTVEFGVTRGGALRSLDHAVASHVVGNGKSCLLRPPHGFTTRLHQSYTMPMA